MDIGQGSDSVLAAIVAEELGIQPADVRLVTATNRALCFSRAVGGP